MIDEGREEVKRVKELRDVKELKEVKDFRRVMLQKPLRGKQRDKLLRFS
jgi:hypothetical protein